MGIIASKSNLLSKLLMDHIAQQKDKQSGDPHHKIVIDFQGQVLYQAFKKVIDYCYIDDLSILNSINDSNEMTEMMKLANQFNLSNITKSTESIYQEHVINLLDSNSTCLSIKTQMHNNFSIKKRTNNNNLSISNSTSEAIKDININVRSQQSRGVGAPQQLPQS